MGAEGTAGMPLLAITHERKTAALGSLQSDLQYIFAENGVSVDLQVLLAHQGYVNPRLFIGIEETNAQMRNGAEG